MRKLLMAEVAGYVVAAAGVIVLAVERIPEPATAEWLIGTALLVSGFYWAGSMFGARRVGQMVKGDD